MIRKSILFSVLFCSASTTLDAQVFNSSFEQTDSTGHISHWGREYLIPAWYDLSTGQSYSDSIVIDQGYCTPVTDAHTGNKAMELRNAYDYTAGQGIAGRADLSFAQYNYDVSPNRLPILQAPAALSFYYKFFPVGTDTAWANMVLYDSSGNEVGGATALIGTAAPDYTFLSIPVTYTAAPASISMSFSTCRPDVVPTFGTRFLVDDVDLGSLGISTIRTGVLHCYPTPAAQDLFIPLPAGSTPICWYITGMDGKAIISGSVAATGNTARLDVSSLPAGSYIVNITSLGSGSYAGRFIKR